MIITSKLTILINGEKPVCLSYELDDVFSFQPEIVIYHHLLKNTLILTESKFANVFVST